MLKNNDLSQQYLDTVYQAGPRRVAVVGFTIVELLIVIVVIGILAAIVIVAFNGVQNRAYDSAVQSDLASIGKKIQVHYAMNDTWPINTTDLTSMGLKVSKNAYSEGFNNGSGYYNIVYCWPTNATNPNTYAIVAMSKSGKVIENRNGLVREASYAYTGGSGSICSNAGVPLDSGSTRTWLYSNGSWVSYV